MIPPLAARVSIWCVDLGSVCIQEADWRCRDRLGGKFTWFSFVACSLGSALEHPQWEVGILCWVAYNLLFYRTRSLQCLMVTHGITNLVLYVYVVRYEDWVFW